MGKDVIFFKLDGKNMQFLSKRLTRDVIYIIYLSTAISRHKFSIRYHINKRYIEKRHYELPPPDSLLEKWFCYHERLSISIGANLQIFPKIVKIKILRHYISLKNVRNSLVDIKNTGLRQWCRLLYISKFIKGFLSWLT